MIPKIIHYCWLGGNPKPKSVLKCIDSWKKYCPDYEIKEWNESNLDIQSMPLYVRQAYEAKAWGFVPDYIRLWLVYQYGGIYLDTDVQIIKSLNPLLKLNGYVGFEDKNHQSIGIGVGMGVGIGEEAESCRQTILEHMHIYEKMSFVNEDGTLNRTPSPVITTDFLVTKGLKLGVEGVQNIGGLTVYPWYYFSPKSFDTGETRIAKNTYSIHQYDASWFNDDEKKQHAKNLRKYKIQKITKLPNRVLLSLLGAERYSKMKAKLKGKG